MLQSAWLFIGVVSILATGVALLTKTQGAALIPNDDGMAIFAGVVGFVSWGIWSYGALDLETVTDSGTVVSHSMPAVTYLGVALALIPAYIALTGPVDIIRRSKNPTTDDI